MKIDVSYETDNASQYQVLKLQFADYMESGFEPGEFVTTHMSGVRCDVTMFLSEQSFEKLAEALGDMACRIRADRRAAKKN